MDPSTPLLFAPQSARPWAQRVAARLGWDLAAHEERLFEDGEHKMRPLVNVRGREVYVLQSLQGDASESVDDKLCRLLFFIGTLRDASAASVTAVVPYLAYARKERKTQPRDPVSTRYVAAMFEAVGTDRIVALEVHNLAAFQNAFRCRTEHLHANHLFADHFARLVGSQEVVVVSPDAGGIPRAERFRQQLARTLGRPVDAAFAEKHRSGGVVRGELLAGEVEGRCAIVLDDLIATGGTIVRTARACMARGARSVHAAATHGLFVQDAGQLLADDSVAGIVVCDSVPPWRLEQGPAREKLTVLATDGLFAEAIRRLHTHGSLTELLA